MKTTLNAEELREMNACSDGLNTFINAHGENDATLSQALDSNGWDDIWWYISNAQGKFSKKQIDDLHLIGCKWARGCLKNFEKELPEDKRPRLAIEAKEKHINGEISIDELKAAWSAARSAARSAEPAESAAWSARSAAESAARSAAWSAARSARSAARSAETARSAMKEDLMQLLIAWEDHNKKPQ